MTSQNGEIDPSGLPCKGFQVMCILNNELYRIPYIKPPFPSWTSVGMTSLPLGCGALLAVFHGITDTQPHAVTLVTVDPRLTQLSLMLGW